MSCKVFFSVIVFAVMVYSQVAQKVTNERNSMVSNILKKDDKVTINNVHGWFIGEKESSPHAQQESIMNAFGDNHDYSYYVGISGLAFRMQVSKAGFCPSSPHPYCGYKCDRAARLFPW